MLGIICVSVALVFYQPKLQGSIKVMHPCDHTKLYPVDYACGRDIKPGLTPEDYRMMDNRRINGST